MAQTVILQGCDLERSRSSMKVKTFLSGPRHLPIKCEVSSKSYGQCFCYGVPIVDQKVARKKKERKKERKKMT